jgi:hypothetical protein
MNRRGVVTLGVLLLLSLQATLSRAEVTRVDVATHEDTLGGRSFGAVGAYEWITGRAHFALDPSNAANDIITDLKLAPRNTEGRVEFSAELIILRPKDPARANGVVLFDVANRGRLQILSFLNQGTGTSRTADAYLGDGLLMKQGYTIVWIGWEQGLPAASDLVHLFGPVIKDVRGMVYGDIQVSARVADVSLADRGYIPYPVADPRASENRLTVQAALDATPRLVPRDAWSFGRMQNGALVDDPMRLYLKDGFEPGAVYQIVYVAKDPQVVGLGLAGVRDVITWVRHDPTALVHATRAYAFGMSQSGRFLRQFLHDGFNADTAGRQVFDAMMIHIAGGSSRGFNERFAQPSRNGLSRTFPFTDVEQTDPETGTRDGLLTKAQRQGVVPTLIYTSSSWEYWGSLASNIHTSIDGSTDLDLPDTSRVYLLASTQHIVPAFPPRYSVPPSSPPVTGAELIAAPAERGQLRVNTLNYRPVLRALFVALDQWVQSGTLPPPSSVPRIADKTLVSRAQLNMKGFATVTAPTTPQLLPRLDAGETTRGVPTVIPPREGKAYVARVPQVDDDGNDVAGIRVPELTVPLATHTGWNLRDPSIGASTDLIQMNGSYNPFPRTVAERERTHDSRRAIEERYPSVQHYLGLIAQAAHRLVDQRFLLSEDVFQVLTSAEAHWAYATSPEVK